MRKFEIRRVKFESFESESEDDDENISKVRVVYNIK